MGSKKYQKEYEQFINEKHTCKCGCGTILIPKYINFSDCMYRHKRPPEYAPYHFQKKTRKDKSKKTLLAVVEHNGCKINLLSVPMRCEDYQNCKKYLDCLDFVIKSNAKGWAKAE